MELRSNYSSLAGLISSPSVLDQPALHLATEVALLEGIVIGIGLAIAAITIGSGIALILKFYRDNPLPPDEDEVVVDDMESGPATSA